MPEITVRYYAVLRQQRGVSEETVATDAATPAALYAALQAAHGFTLSPATLKVAVNDEFADWSVPLADGDQVVFIAPVAGG